VPLTVGSSTAEAERAAFLFDLASPSCWLVAERVLQVMPVATEWVPVRAPGPLEGEGFRCAEEESIWRAAIEHRADELGLQPVRWPAEVPFDSDLAMRVATYAKVTGRVVAFALAAFRQAWCGGRSLAEPDSVLIAAAACELHPKAVLKGAELRTTRAALDRASAGAVAVPAIVLPGGETFVGEDAPERAAAAAAAAAGTVHGDDGARPARRVVE
jgi:2-hydroxychromene-2-carboxylate isomerase